MRDVKNRDYLWTIPLIISSLVFSGGIFLGYLIGIDTSKRVNYENGYREGYTDAIKTFLKMQAEEQRELYDDTIRKSH